MITYNLLIMGLWNIVSQLTPAPYIRTGHMLYMQSGPQEDSDLHTLDLIMS